MPRMGGFALPSLFVIGGYRIFLWSNENGEPIHVHVCKGVPHAGATKIWLTSKGGCVVAQNNGDIPTRILNELMEIISAQFEFICAKWRTFYHVDSIQFYC